jgi:hypothetical protein
MGAPKVKKSQQAYIPCLAVLARGLPRNRVYRRRRAFDEFRGINSEGHRKLAAFVFSPVEDTTQLAPKVANQANDFYHQFYAGDFRFRSWDHESPSRQKSKYLPFRKLQPPRILAHFAFFTVGHSRVSVLCCFFWTQIGHSVLGSLLVLGFRP